MKNRPENLGTYHKWTTKETTAIRDGLESGKTLKQIAAELGRTYNSTRQHFYNTIHREWKAEEERLAEEDSHTTWERRNDMTREMMREYELVLVEQMCSKCRLWSQNVVGCKPLAYCPHCGRRVKE